MSNNQNSTGGSKLSVCIDLDGVLAQYDGWRGVEHIGDPIPGAVDFVNNLSDRYRIIIHTTRVNPDVNKDYTQEELDLFVQQWLSKHEFIWDEIRSKPIAVAYVDDRAVNCRPQDYNYNCDSKVVYINATRCVIDLATS